MQGNSNAIQEVKQAPPVDRIAVIQHQLDEVERLYMRVLDEGKDYGIPQGMRIKKPFLYLAGIEKCLRLHKLTPKFVLTYAERDWNTPRFYFEVACRLLDEDSAVVAEGSAVSHTEESSYKPTQFGRSSKEDLVLAGINRCRKMGDIRALRSAIKIYGMLSHIFNIDEDTFDDGQVIRGVLDPYTAHIESGEHVNWLANATGVSAKEIANILGIKSWRQWKGTVLDAYDAIRDSQTGRITSSSVQDAELVEPVESSELPAYVSELKEKLDGDIADDLLMEFLGITNYSDYQGDADSAYRQVLESIARQAG